jgi:hypothetical protein
MTVIELITALEQADLPADAEVEVMIGLLVVDAKEVIPVRRKSGVFVVISGDSKE